MPRIDPALPMLRIEPALPMLKMDPELPMLSTEPTLPMLSMEPALRMLPTLKRLRKLYGLFLATRYLQANRIASRRAVLRCAFFPIRAPRARLLPQSSSTPGRFGRV
jgi:hypothetical protein